MPYHHNASLMQILNFNCFNVSSIDSKELIGKNNSFGK